jgi:hypothetical protein
LSDFSKNICFPGSFRGNMCKTGANAQGSLKTFAFFAKNELFWGHFSKKQKGSIDFRENFRET